MFFIEADKFLKYLRSLKSFFIDDVDDVYEKMATEEKNKTEIRFDTKIRYDGYAMKPNAPLTILKKGRNDPLIDTGQLSESIEYDFSINGWAVGSNDRYAISNQTGKGVPPRPFLGITDERAEKLIDILMDSIGDIK